ncbi:alpha/beta fold hydrolase [Pengzhenrongella frigida]|uniref:AB hydrolase-1 domain-containing protein n=1 Tax=Pengzhenrongella frigida TaxID=1259133 RepID=A0A4Q5MWV6_9MICO|nr:alpha/beta fold hydrolase [Cellulomonas sp. HLT2-17]RYV49413.1 hypothetical protein EUA98_18910 [Cellulomonas sp. HLT2-17]
MTPTSTPLATRLTARAVSRRPRWTPLRAAFTVLDRLAPPLAARWAIHIWCTMPKNAGRRRDARPGAGVRSDLTTAAGCRLAVEAWGDGPPVYLAHGWGGWRGQMGAFITPLVEAGYRVVVLDAPGHGDSGPGAMGPGRGNAAEFTQALTELTDAHGRAGASSLTRSAALPPPSPFAMAHRCPGSPLSNRAQTRSV